MKMKKLKPIIKFLIQAYYESPDNYAGGNLHIVLDDGNIEHANIRWCKKECKKNNDSIGRVICDILLQYTEEELQIMYDEDWWGMDDREEFIGTNK